MTDDQPIPTRENAETAATPTASTHRLHLPLGAERFPCRSAVARGASELKEDKCRKLWRS